MRPDFFVLSGLQGLKKFYVRGQISGDEVRGMTILYDQATEGTMAPVVIAMSSAFTPFPTNAAQAVAPPPRKKVEYATGIVVGADGAIVTDRQAVDGCQFIVVPGYGNADRVAEDKTRDLALLRIYGARDLKPIAFAERRGKAERGAHRHRRSAKPGRRRDGDHRQCDPVGHGTVARACDRLCRRRGRRQRRHVCRRDLAEARGRCGNVRHAPATMLRSCPPDQVREFLKANGVTATSGQKADAKASVLRVICVRK